MRKLPAVAVLAVLTLDVGFASAIEPSAGLLVGNGFKDGYNLGIGARAGVSLPLSIYIGGTFVYHLGIDEGRGRFGVYYFGAEGGYDAGVGPLTIRPYLGLGYAAAHASYLSSNRDALAIWPGATALVGLGGAFVGADARYVVIIDEDNANALALFATGGLKF